ncbi:MAG: squalene/phytoene synthase family protein [Pseudomonadota bacterium]|nr:squalene/phytoene synthase family protein [Pseudomonadota bacterium]
MPAGSARYWSWLFAAPPMRAPLLGMYALLAEWHALMDPATETGVAHLKLAWWGEEMQRLQHRSGVHPISVYLASLPNADAVDFNSLTVAVASAAAQVGGAPLERGADLEPQSRALRGDPLALASHLAFPAITAADLRGCTTSLAAAEYLANALGNFRREARLGRVSFAIDELLAAGIENSDLAADVTPPHLQRYLDQVRERARRCFEVAAAALTHAQRAECRHLLVSAALGLAHLSRSTPTAERRRLRDMLLAWSTARRANR